MTAPAVAVSTESRLAVADFLFHEAELLDARDLTGWLDLLDPAIDYRIPIRTTREARSGQSVFSSDSFFQLEDFGSLRARVSRFDSEHAWSENPPAATRRFVSNVRVRATSGSDGDFDVTSNLLFSWTRDTATSTISARREDLLVARHGDFQLYSRIVLLDQTSLPLPHLGMFL